MEFRKICIGTVLLLLLVAVPISVAQGVQVGTEFQVNTYTTDNQDNPSVAMDADGDFVITWMSGPGQDGSMQGVFAQRFMTVSGVINDISDNVDNQGVATSLTTLLSKALDALNRGNLQSFERILTAFIKQVTMLSGKQIDTEYANTLIQWVQAWLEDSSQV